MKDQHAVEQFLYKQADLLDTKQWQKWIDLFTDDGVYWMPPDASYKTWEGQPAIFAEDKNLMTVRMNRVLHPDAWSQKPLWGTNHVVSNVVIQKVTSKGGTTEAGLKVLQKGSFEKLIQETIKAATRRAQELRKEN